MSFYFIAMTFLHFLPQFWSYKRVSPNIFNLKLWISRGESDFFDPQCSSHTVYNLLQVPTKALVVTLNWVVNGVVNGEDLHDHHLKEITKGISQVRYANSF